MKLIKIINPHLCDNTFEEWAILIASEYLPGGVFIINNEENYILVTEEAIEILDSSDALFDYL